jgi:uncharacterized membrane protein YgcG
MPRLAERFRPLNLVLAMLLLVVTAGGFFWRSHQINARKPASSRPDEQSTYIFDYARLLSNAEPELNRAIVHLKDTYDIEPIVVTVTTIPDELTLPELARRLIEDWQIGANPDGRGILILAASDVRRVHLAVGPGLFETFTDSFRRQIQDWPWQNYFEDGSVPGGLRRALAQIETRARQVRGP